MDYDYPTAVLCEGYEMLVIEKLDPVSVNADPVGEVRSELSERLHDLDGSTPDPNLLAQLLFGPDPDEATVERARLLVHSDAAGATET